MARRFTLALGLAAAASLLASAGCATTSSNHGAADGAVMTPDGQIDASACIAAGGFCASGDINCTAVGTDDCGPGGFCCLPNAVVPDAGSCPDGGIQAASYNQTCTTDSDCVAVGFSNACFACEIGCANSAINKSAEAQYRSDVAKTPANGADCGCPASGGACCVSGECQVDGQCFGTILVADAAADTGAAAAPDSGPADAGRE